MKEVIRTLILAGVLSVCGLPASAQDIVGGTGRQDLSGGAGTIQQGSQGSRRPAVRYVTKTRTVTVTKIVQATKTTGTLAVAVEPNAELLIEPVGAHGGEAQVGKVPTGERLFIFNDLKPGRYRVAAELEGYRAAEQEVTVSANKSTPITLDLQPVLYTVNINANVERGEIRYAPVESQKDPATGEVKYQVAGETLLTQLQNRRAVLPNLRPGTYGVDIRAAEVGYQTLLGTVTVPGKTSIDVHLVKVLSTKTFLAAWTSDEWDLPGGWKVAASRLLIDGPGVALPADESSYHHYADFQLFSDVKMLNDAGVGFALRGLDKQNYYLVELTGAGADEPYHLRGFIIKNGNRQRFGTIPISHLASTIKPNQFFKVSIKVKDNNLDVSVADSQTGEFFPLGVLTDSDRNFTVGAVGLAAQGKEKNEVGSFIICTPECPKQ